MLIWFGNWDLYRLEKHKYERFEENHIKYFKVWIANIIELQCINEDMIDFLINNYIDLSYFSRISLHSPNLEWHWVSERILWKIRIIVDKFNIKNVVIHPDQIENFDIFENFKDLPLSIENMDDEKSFGQMVEDIWPILDKYNFLWLTLDLQHCFVNDNSMKIAKDFHNKYSDRIVEYHISWYNEKFIHYKLYETKQNDIIKSWIKKDIPTIIESTFDHPNELQKELNYIL